ncbi:hypothetical protein [Bradyrhizobium niftali]|uniref:Uncharacterized protein n=1 Tax=Bradyrhizobium niftali TaxID=2560055 RepID=A0A4Y9L312_9BRAD|nr:hypothetical protein [Bradyrhizobium niftali]TFV37960.1 hypothetical protein E4K65_42505 [Bradyrhizobium niftali]
MGVNETTPSVVVTGVLSVDEASLDATMRNFKKGDKIGVKWPQSSDQLISLVQEVTRRFDKEHIAGVGADEFIKSAPEALRNTFRDRAKCEKRLPELMDIMSDFGKYREGRPDLEEYYLNCRAGAIKFYLLRANFFAHWKLGYLSSWVGLSRLGLSAPAAWKPYQGMPSDKFYPFLYDEYRTQHISSIRLVKIGNYEITCHGCPDWIYIDIPEASLDRSGNLCAGEDVLCRWAIPQVELSGQLRIPPPDSYNGEWVGYTA